ncbi:hypothetical protein BDV26DRAFT_287850 [Aspergillus bertholletiae]|uniref:Alcohol acetyltransferase n=1 Tax=Aspergillus bertholletiae TaxID=1226010 RepID=A0A5N7BML1_9EURO|nr:hypothetical protein BDV26DRAFT_287850 [Aspergillus bertholletiae]
MAYTTRHAINSSHSGRGSIHWKKADRGHYMRPFDPFEETFSSLCHDPVRPEFRNLDVFLSVGIESASDPNTIIETAKKAWMRMRYLHPSLAAEVTGKSFQYVPLETQSDVEKWLEKSFVVKDGEPMADMQGCIDLSVIPVTENAVLYYFPADQKFMLRMSHMFGDGHWVIYFLQELFAEMSRLNSGGQVVQGPLGEEVHNLASSAFDAAGITMLPDPWSTKAQSLLPQPQASKPAFEIPCINNALPPGAGKIQSLDFSEDETSSLLKASRTMGLGITTFLHTAFIHAAREISPSSDSKVHSTVLIFSFRDQCIGLPPYAHDRGSSPRIGFWPVQVDISDDFHRTARRLKHEYEVLARQKPAVLATMVPHLQRSIPILSDEHFRGILPSFIGNIPATALPNNYNFFKVRDFCMVAVPANERIYLGVMTFKNKLSINIAYNQTYHSDEQIAGYLGQIKREIYEGVMSEIGQLRFLSTARL